MNVIEFMMAFKKAAKEKDVEIIKEVKIRVYDRVEGCYTDVQDVRLKDGDIIIDVD